MAPKRIFISYSHAQGDWICNRLRPCLSTGSADVSIDRERFIAGKAVVEQMDSTRDSAELQLLVLSPEYLVSDYCCHEKRRAVAVDPRFEHCRVVPLVRCKCPMSTEIAKPNPLLDELCDDGASDQWDLLFEPCDVDLETRATDWLRARDNLRRHLERGDFYCDVAAGNA